MAGSVPHEAIDAVVFRGNAGIAPAVPSFGPDFEQTLRSLHCLLAPEYLAAIRSAAVLLTQTLARGGKVLCCGNGGSAADAQHIAAGALLVPLADTDRIQTAHQISYHALCAHLDAHFSGAG